MNLKPRIIFDLHKIFLCDFQSADFELTMDCMLNVLSRHNLKFIDGEEGCVQFFEDVNSVSCNREIVFTNLCGQFIDFQHIVAKDNEAMYPDKPYAVTMVVTPVVM